MIPLYMDEHVPKAITIGLRLRGIDVLTVQEDNFSGKSDPELLDRAVFLKRTVFSHDEDLLVEATKRQRAGPFFSVHIFQAIHQTLPLLIFLFFKRQPEL